MNSTIIPPNTNFAHIEFRPIFDFGDHCVVCSIYDADYFGAYGSPAGQPACRDDYFDEAFETLTYIFDDPKFAGARRWYNGNEICVEITCREDLYKELAGIHCGEESDYVQLGERLGFNADEVAKLMETVGQKSL